MATILAGHSQPNQVPPPSDTSSLIGEIPLRNMSAETLLPSYNELAPPDLALTREYISAPLLYVEGSSKHPDLQVRLPEGQPLYALETESTVVYHETHVKDLHTPSSLFYIRRKPIEDEPESHARYSINVRSPAGGGDTKILEVDTDPGILLGKHVDSWSTRLIFRNAFTGELDGLTLTVTKQGLSGSSFGAEVSYQRKKVADIILKRKSDPLFELRVYKTGMDPLLVVILAYVLDDRYMTMKRRLRSTYRSGLPGIGKGPGAGLAMAFGIGSMVS